MRQINFGMTLSLLLATTLLISGCSSFYKPEKEIVTITKLVEREIPTVPHPKTVQMNDVKVYVVNEEIYEEFVKEFTAENGELAFVALSMKDYENLALNVAELRRFINQQKNIIVYYEKAVTEENTDD